MANPTARANSRPNGTPAEVDGFDHVRDWVFDLDNTLYPAACNLFGQIDVKIGEFVQDLLQVDQAEARRVQKQYFREHGTTLRGLMDRHGVNPEEFLDYVHEIDVSPVPPSPDLEKALAALRGRKVIFTNGTTRHAENVLNRLGVAHHFNGIFDIADADYRPKPEPSVYRQLIERHGIEPHRAVFFEDMARNLAPAAALGMTTVWIRTDAPWSSMDADPQTIHYAGEDLLSVLNKIVAARQCPVNRTAVDR